ncbi:MAG: tetratricopeptide repeat protein [Bacteroidales bacterium]|nr:tetratricopeptide repeat protein [Bacteroidales bacterium]
MIKFFIIILLLFNRLFSQEKVGIRKSEYWLIKSYIHKVHSEYEEMYKCYETALKLNPKDDAIYFKIANYNITHKKDYHKAIECYKKAIKINKTEYYYWFYLIETFININDYKSAIHYTKKALKYFPNNDGLNEKLLQCYIETQNFSKAITILKKMIMKDPTNIELKKILYDIYITKNKNKKSYEIAKEIIKLKPNDLEMLYNLSIYYLTTNNKSELNLLKEYIKGIDNVNELVNWINLLINIYFEKNYNAAYNDIMTLLQNINNIDILIGFNHSLSYILKQNSHHFGVFKTDSIFQKIFTCYNKLSQNSEDSRYLELLELILDDYYKFLTVHIDSNMARIKYNYAASLIYNKNELEYWKHKILYYVSLLELGYNFKSLKHLNDSIANSIYDTIIRNCDTAIFMYPYIFDFYLIKAKYQLIFNHYENAEQTLNLLVKENELLADSINANSLYLNLRANLYYHKENYDLAQEYMCKYLENKNFNCRHITFYYYLKIKNNNYHENNMEQTLQNCLKTDSSNYFIYSVLGLLKTKQKKYSEAISYYSMFLSNIRELTPEIARIYNDIGDMFYELNDIEQAKEFWNLAIENNYTPQNVFYKLNN